MMRTSVVAARRRGRDEAQNLGTGIADTSSWHQSELAAVQRSLLGQRHSAAWPPVALTLSLAASTAKQNIWASAIPPGRQLIILHEQSFDIAHPSNLARHVDRRGRAAQRLWQLRGRGGRGE